MGTQFFINHLRKVPEFKEVWDEHQDELRGIFLDVSNGEKMWAEYLFKDGSMLGLNKNILCMFVEYMTNIRMDAVGLGKPYPEATENPIPWIFDNGHLASDSLQVAPQEVENSDYQTGNLDMDFDDNDLEDLEF